MPRTRLSYPVRQTAAGPGVILDETLPYNAQLLQYSARVQGAPATSFEVIIRKESRNGADYSVDIFAWDPTAIDSDDIICNDRWEFLKDDRVTISSTNPDALTIGHELIFREAE